MTRAYDRNLCTLLTVALLGITACQPAVESGESPGWKTQSPFAALDLPAATATRSASGRPGAGYWQQRVDYTLEASVSTETHLLQGTGRIAYHNRSPDALPFLWLKLDANLCDPLSVTAVLDVPPLLFGEEVFDFGCHGASGMRIEHVTSRGRPVPFDVYGTVARLNLAAPVPPGGMTELEISWQWVLPEYGYGRMDREGTLYQVAQWYPRFAVYDDVRGWNIDPFLGAGEFYQEYGDFRVALTVPAAYVIAATGTLENPAEVLTAAQRVRLARAQASDTAVQIITKDEALASREAPASGSQTWRFSAAGVRDFAFAMAPDFRWDASTWDGTLIQTFYRPEATLWEEANRMSWVTIRHFSERLARYPWPHATTIEGPNGGMEYPMLTFVPSGTTREDLYWVLTHEFGHMWYPMLVNSNERLHPWMDEGFNTFIDITSVEEYFAGEAFADTIDVQPLHLYPLHAFPGREQAMALPPDEQLDLYWAAYFKPALMMHLLRTEVVGTERFDRAFHEYTVAWSFKHPTPADFFRFMEDATGMRLDWFWRGWIYGTARLDQAIERVEQDAENGETRILLRSRGDLLMPAELQMQFADGSSDTVRLPVEMWKLGPAFTYRLHGDRVPTRVMLDPRGIYPDDDRSNDVWPR
jgi:hypothetical protein